MNGALQLRWSRGTLNWRRLALCFAAWLAASAAAAQPASPPDAPSTAVSPLTVTAPPKPKVVDKQAHAFVHGYAAPTDHQLIQIGRWYDAVCVQVTGVIPDQADAIKARVESVAQAVGLHAPRAGCKANVRIMFGNRPRPLLRPIEPFYEVTYGRNPITHRFIPTIRFSTVVIAADAKSLEGKDLGLVTDYLAMLVLSQPKSLDGCYSFSSVIDIYAKAACPGRDPPDGLTPADAAFLTALYEEDLDIEWNFEQGDISRRMAQILVKANASAMESAAATGSPPPADPEVR